MNILGIRFGESDKNTNFKGVSGSSLRVSKNTVAQLAKNNPYSLTAANQRNITNAIEILGKIPGESNIKFLLNTAAKNTYQTNIKLKNNPKNNWKSMLLAAAASAIAITPFVNQTAFAQKIKKINSSHSLNETEKAIMQLRENLLNSVDLEQISKATSGTIKDFEKNLDYFIISSETTLEHKKYVLEKLNYLMSEEYKINEQLKDKKSIVVAEMVNDMAIAVPGNKIPNIKAVNQKNHGICAEIAIARKKLVYEDKPNYVDSIISELDDSDSISVYDRTKLGSGEKTLIPKAPVDYDAALKKGYRIIDASSMVWMQASKSSGYTNISYSIYNPFDQSNFDVKNDSFFNTNFQDEELAKMQHYYQALLKLKSSLESYKSSKIKKRIDSQEVYQHSRKYQEEMSIIKDNIENMLRTALPGADTANLSNNILKLRYLYSKSLKGENKYEYIDNEEDSVKKEKIRGFISEFASKNVDENVINKLFDSTEYYHELADKLKQSNYKTSVLSKAQRLYEIAADFRNAFLNGVEIDAYLKNYSKNEGLPNKERLLVDTVETLLSKVKSNSSESEIIVKQLSETLCPLMESSKDKKGVIEALNKVRIASNYVFQNMFDLTYNSLLLEDRKHALISYIDNLIVQIADNKDTVLKNQVASNLNVNNYEKIVVGTLKSYKNKLYTSGEKEYSNIFDKIYGDSQFDVLRSVLYDLKSRLDTDEKENVLNLYKEAVENPDEFDEEKLKEMIDSHLQMLDSTEKSVDEYIQAIKVVNNNGHILYSADKKDVLLKKYENLEEILSVKDLTMIQEHLDRIMKIKSADEFNSISGKIKDKSVYKFSPRERYLFAIIDKNVNSMYSYVQKYISDIRKTIKIPLEELYREAGVDSGRWWMTEGESGLFGGNQVKILEFLTGRPHYLTNELKKAIEKIKESPYSGISSSSVFDDKIGMHAQYIADVTPVKLKSGDKEIIKEVLFHDNTWGPKEHDNTWVDSTGLKRTDYSDRRGGKLGYVTNDLYQNGNIVERILSDMTLEEKSEQVNSKIYKKIKKGNDYDYKSSQYTDMIVDGKSPKLKEYADNIRQNIFQSTVRLVQDLEKLVKNMTTEEVKSKIKTASYDGGSWRTRYNSILAEIYDKFKGKDNIDELYKSLPDKDKLKLILEKVALKSNYNSTLMINDIAKTNNISDLKKFSKRQRLNAINSFKYSFSKDVNFIQYCLNNFDENNVAAIDKILKKYNIDLDDETYDNIFVSYDVEDKDWNGSLKYTIDNLLKQMSSKMDKSINDSNAKRDLLNYMRTIFRDTLYFNKSDITNPKLENIIKFIDREFKPADDEELISIYRKMQDMTSDTFKKEVLSRVTNEDLGIKSNTGLDVLKKLLTYDEKIEQSLMDEVYYEDISDVIEDNTYKPLYSYNKLTRDISYTYKDTFDSAYRKVKQDLYLLELPRLFNKYKNRNLVNYNAYPAYPKIDYIDQDMFQNIFNSTIGKIPDIVQSSNFAKTTEHYYEAIKVLKDYAKSKRDSEVLDEDEFKALMALLQDIASSIYNNELQQDALKETLEAMNMPQDVKFAELRKHINAIVQSANNYEKSFSKNDIKLLIDGNRDKLKSQSEVFVNTFIQKKHRVHMLNLINQYIQSLSKLKPVKDIQPSDYLQQIFDGYSKWHIMQNTEELLNAYIESLTVDSNMSDDRKENIKNMLITAISYARMADMETIIMEALENGDETLVKDAFKEIYLETTDGDTVPMSNDFIVYQMVDNLVLLNNKDTAQMFIEKLGLNEQYAAYVSNNFSVDKLKEMVDASGAEDKMFSKFAEEFDKLAEETYKNPLLEIKPNTVINRLKRDVMTVIKENKIPSKTAKPLIKAFDDAKRTIEKKPTLKKAEVLKSILNDGMYCTIMLSDKNNDQLNHDLDRTHLFMELLNDLPLASDSEANKLRNETIQKWSDFLAYCDTKENLHVV